MDTPSSEIIAAAAASVKIENNQSTPDQSNESSYHDKISKILTRWQQLQKEMKVYQQQQHKHQVPFVAGMKQEKDDFDRIMEEDLENQLKELELQEEEQYKLMEQAIEEELQQQYQSNSIDDFEEDHIEQLMQLHELERIIEEEEEEQRRHEKQFKKDKTWKRHEQFYHLEQFKKYQREQEQSNRVNTD